MSRTDTLFRPVDLGKLSLKKSLGSAKFHYFELQKLKPWLG